MKMYGFALTPDHPDDEFCTDYTLNEGYDSCWITVDNVSVYIRRTDEGDVIVELLPLHDEEGQMIDTAEAIAKSWCTRPQIP